MVFPILGGNGAVAGGYSIDNSLRFNDGDSPYLQRTQGSGGNRRTWTFSCWVKLSEIATNTNFIFSASDDGSSNTEFKIQNHELVVDFWNGSSSSYRIDSSNLLRDASAFYHLVLRVDTTQSTSADRVRMYINGTQVTAFNTNTVGSQNFDTDLNNGGTIRIGADARSPADYWDGYMTEVYMIEGQSLAPTSFAEADEDSGIWKPKAYEGTYTGNSFYLDFENSGSLGADVSGLGNNFTPTNLASTDQTTDTPTNNFATLNPLDNYYANSTFSEGNVKISQNNDAFNTSTMKMSSGKWYWEAKLGNTSGYDSIGITQNVATSSGQVLGNLSTAYGMRSDSGNIITNNSGNSYGVSFTSGDIIGVGLDLDNNKLYFSKNGTWMNSADPSAGTGGFSISAGEYFAGFGKQDVATGSTWEVNFGNPNFSISSENSDGDGYGNFEYAVPAGFYALNTKNLATYG